MSTFALISDPHVSVTNPDTGWQAPPIPLEPTMYDRSVELLAAAIDEINALPALDFVLVAGDLTRDSEPYNHDRARERSRAFASRCSVSPAITTNRARPSCARPRISTRTSRP